MWNQTYAREYQRTSDDWGDARKPIATLRTGLRLGAEYLVTLIGTALFTYVNEWNYVNEARKRFIHHVGNSHSYRIHRARFKVKLGIWMEAGP